MENIERIINAKNRVFQGGLGLGKDNPISLHTDSSHVYRVTGSSQIEDIINCGYVRPPLGKAKGGHTGEVFWTKGNEKLFFYDKRPVIETSTDILKEEGQMGAISLDKLTGVWMFDEQQNKYVNNIQAVRNAYNKIHPEQEQISQLREQISEYDKQINTLLANMQPYMQIPKVNREISKVIEKNNEISSSQIIDSLNDYKTVVEIKQSLLTYLEQANKFIKDNVGKQQETVAQQQNQTKESTNISSNGFQGRIYNDDGTYTTEYITHVSTSPSGFNQEYYDRLMKENEFKRKQNEDPTSLLNDSNVWGWINDEEQMTSGERHM